MEGTRAAVLKRSVSGYIMTYTYTAHAVDTFTRVIAYIWILIKHGHFLLNFGTRAFVLRMLYLKLYTHGLQLAGSVSRTAHTVKIVIGQKKPEHILSVFRKLFSFRGDDHPVLSLRPASRKQLLKAFNLNGAEPARPHITDALQKAQCGYVNIVCTCYFKDGCAF